MINSIRIHSFMVACIAVSYIMAAPQQGRTQDVTLAGVSCGDFNTCLYMPLTVYQAFSSHDATILTPLKTVKSMVEQFTCLTVPVNQLARCISIFCRTDDLVIVTLADESVFLVPRTFFSFFECVVKENEFSLCVDRASMRAFMHLVSVLAHDLVVNSPQNEQVIRDYLHDPAMPRPQDLRRIQRVLWALSVKAPWVKRALLGIDADEGDSVSVDSEESGYYTSSDSAFTEGHASCLSGEKKVRKKTVLGIAHSQGCDAFRCMFPIESGMLALRDQGLTSIAHLAEVLALVYTAEERMAIRSLDISGNQIQALPAGAFSCLPQLQELIVSENPLRHINEDAFLGLGQLLQLSISHAPGICLPAGVLRHVPRLEVLFLAHNELTALPDLAVVSRLKILDVMNNSLLQIPDASMLNKLEVYNLMDNLITVCDLSRLPRDAAGKISLITLQLNDNHITELSTLFYDALPTHQAAALFLHNNPVWNALNAPATRADFADNGFAQFTQQQKTQGALIAGDISDALFEDTCKKVGRYVAGRYDMHEVLLDEVRRCRAARDIYTRISDAGVWVYTHQKFIIAGLVLISGGIGAGIGYLVKKVCASVLTRVFAGAAIGALSAGILGYFGINHVLKDGKLYLNYGRDSVLMSSDLKAQYVGLVRIISLLALLKQYLVGFNTCLFWLIRYDEHADNGARINVIMTHLEAQMQLEQQRLFARIDDPTTIATLHELIAINPLGELRRRVADDMFEGATLAAVDVADGADVAWFGVRRLELLRDAVSVFAANACRVRALLVNRYVGTVDHSRVCRVISDSEGLFQSLQRVMHDVLLPVELQLHARGHGGDTLFHDIAHFKEVAMESMTLLQQFVAQKDAAETIIY